jgi:DNA invertase Pin-like site-specific DNA recombinase
VRHPTDPVGRLLFNVLAMVAEFESDLIRMRTREGMKVARPKAAYAASSPSSARRRKRISSSSTAPASNRQRARGAIPVTRSTIYRAVARAGGRTALAPASDPAT